MQYSGSNFPRLRGVLKKIYNVEVALEPDHRSKKKVLDFFLDKFEEFCMKESYIFKNFFRGFYRTGSYFEGLRVSEATEFDVDVVFAFLPHTEYWVDELKNPLLYATLQLKHPSSFDIGSVPLFDDDNYLIGKKIRSWFQSLVESFIAYTSLVYPGLLQVKITHSGPARTLKVLYKLVWISIDLVPVWSIDAVCLQKYTLENVHVSKKSLSNCILVPKPLKMELSSMLSTEDSVERVWRIHFPETEKEILKGKRALKPLIKLMKDLRDKEKWPIPSYFIKVMAFWLVKKNPHPNFWNDSRLGFLFLNFLNAIEMHLQTRYLGHILYPGFNLFHSLSPRTLKNLQIRIGSIISNLKKNPSLAYKLFKVPVLDHRLK